MLDIKHDFAKMLPARLVLERGNDFIQRKMSVDYGSQLGCFDSANKILLLAATADQ